MREGGILSHFGITPEVLLDSVSDGVYVLNTDGFFLYVNRVIEQRSGISFDRFRALHFLDVICEQDHEKARRNFERTMGGEAVEPYELEYRTATGGILTVEINSRPLFSDGRIVGLLGVSRNITVRKRLQRALEESEATAKAMLDSISDPMHMIDRDLNVLWANGATKRIFGEDILGKKCFAVYLGRKTPCASAPCMALQTFRDCLVHQDEIQLKDRRGRKRTYLLKANVALRDGDGQPAAVLMLARDVTLQKDQQREILKRQRYLEAVLRVAPEAIIAVDESHRILEWNPRAEQIFGYSKEGAVGRDLDDLTSGADRGEEARAMTKQVLSGKEI
ncbi:MAG: PAS domain S-box protein, partial [Deltaproteobacteria bacterium]|nr:PAS domain S-box protein [Deltaproteobacteria bacterium]